MLLLLSVQGEETVYLNDLFARLEVTPELAARARPTPIWWSCASTIQTQHHDDLRAYCKRAGIRG